MKNKKELLRMLKFTLFSISAGLIQLSSYTLFYEALHWAPWLAYLVSLILSPLIKAWIPGFAGTTISCFVQMFCVSFVFPWCFTLIEKAREKRAAVPA